MKALVMAIVLLGFVGAAFAQDTAAPAGSGAGMTGANNREPAKAKKKSKKKKHKKKHKAN